MSKRKFTRAHIQEIIRSRAGLDIHQAREITARIISAMAAAIEAGQVIELRGLGTFEPKDRPPYQAHNPRSMAPVDVPARRAVFFRPCGSLKAAMNRRPIAPHDPGQRQIDEKHE
jgi:nucleoid DNA-binding protein